MTGATGRYVAPLRDFGRDDVGLVGGKNASLGEMLGALEDRGIRVPGGVAVTVEGFFRFLDHTDLRGQVDTAVRDLEGGADLREVGARIRRALGRADFPPDLEEQIRQAYQDLCREYGDEVDVAVRSSATAEDLPDASFAGQQETLLNVTGEEDLLRAVQRCFTSLYTDRAIHYRSQKGFSHTDVGLSVAIQKMVRAGTACSGVMFTLDPDTGFPDVVVINGAWGLGEHLVGGSVEPDEWVVHKPGLERGDGVRPVVGRVRGAKQSKMVYDRGGTAATKVVDTRRRERETFVLDEDEVLRLARWGVELEAHYGAPMDVEWAKDGETGELFVLQARPETVRSREGGAVVRTFALDDGGARPLVTGIAIGGAVAAGRVRVITSLEEADALQPGDVLVTEMTDPDWVPVMSRAAAVVCDRGGRTAHAAIVSRELGVTAVVGCDDATRVLTDGQEVTVSCAGGDTGAVYDGRLGWTEQEVDLTDVPDTRTKVFVNLASPGAAMTWWRAPADGIGLARMEFVVSNLVRAHPLALLRFDDLTDPGVRREIEDLTVGYDDLGDYYTDRVSRGLAQIAATRYPDPVVVRLSDFKSNEYADLVGGRQFEPVEENPMLGWRGAARYSSPEYEAAFALECHAVARARGVLGLDNIVVMVPFCRTPEEADVVLGLLARNGLERGVDGLQVYVMCEIPSNVILAEEFVSRFDGMSIGSNDLTQLVLGVDRDSARLADLFDERHPAVVRAMEQVVAVCREQGKYVGICGQGPSDHPELAEVLVRAGITSISVNPDVVVSTRREVARIEAEMEVGAS